jgi:serpin B
MFVVGSIAGEGTDMGGVGYRRATLVRAVAAVTLAGLLAGCGSSAASPAPTPTGRPPSSTSTPAATLSAGHSSAATPGSTPQVVSNGLFDVLMGGAPFAPGAAGASATPGSQLDDFGFDLLRRIGTSTNSCFSPASIALALGMVRPGAKGTTASQMDAVLHSFGAPGEAAQIGALLQLLNAQTVYTDEYGIPTASPKAGQAPTTQLNVADQVFSRKGMPLLPAYLDALASAYDAGIGSLDFGADPEAARKVINAWVSKNTAARIPEILRQGDVTTETAIALVNAIYLKAAWTTPFDPADTSAKTFTTGTGSKVSVQTMALESHFGYAAGSGYRAVELPLGGEGSTLSMVVIVPNDLASFVSTLSAARLAAVVSAESTYDVTLTLPRFSLDSRVDLAKTLQAMGMTDLFDDLLADLSGINGNVPKPLVIDKVIHQANIDVVEEGTTASAATVVIGRFAMGAPGSTPPSVMLNVDRPFVYLVREKTSGAVLFLGAITNPATR